MLSTWLNLVLCHSAHFASQTYGVKRSTVHEGDKELIKQLCVPSNYVSKIGDEKVVYDLCVSDEWLLVYAPLSWSQAHAQEATFALSFDLTQDGLPLDRYGAYGQISFYDFAIHTRTSHKQCPASVLSIINAQVMDGTPEDKRHVTETGFCYNGSTLFIEVPMSSIAWQRDHSGHTWALGMWDIARVLGSAIDRLPQQVSLTRNVKSI